MPANRIASTSGEGPKSAHLGSWVYGTGPRGLWFRAPRLGLRIYGLGFMVHGLGIRVQGLGFAG